MLSIKYDERKMLRARPEEEEESEHPLVIHHAICKWGLPVGSGVGGQIMEPKWGNGSNDGRPR